MNKTLFVIILLTIQINSSFNVGEPFFGGIASKDSAEILMDGFISTIERPEMCGAFLKDGREFYFNKLHQENWAIFVTHLSDGEWKKPVLVLPPSDFTDRDFTLSPDGKRIYFGSNRSMKRDQMIQDNLDIFYIEKLSNGKWSMPVNIGNTLNSSASENYPSIAANGNLYFFTKRKDGIGGCDIYISKFKNGLHQSPQCLGTEINSKKNDWDAFIAPDESYIIFSSQNRDDSYGKQDLYISFKDKNGNWTLAKNMGSKVNSKEDEICPSVSVDGKFLIFTTRRRGMADIYWIDAENILKELK